jgi:hypothetical protein
MVGSTFIATTTPHDLVGIDLEQLDTFDHVALDELLTLDFELALQESGVRWTMGEPIFYDPDKGIAILRINPMALENIIAAQSPLAQSNPEDIAVLRDFVAKHGPDHLYEMALL